MRTDQEGWTHGRECTEISGKNERACRSGKEEKVEKELSQRERIILKMRYGLYNGEEYTQREIARQLGISRSYVSRIEKGAVEKLRKSFS